VTKAELAALREIAACSTPESPATQPSPLAGISLPFALRVQGLRSVEGA
jgi:hypothetical protein